MRFFRVRQNDHGLSRKKRPVCHPEPNEGSGFIDSSEYVRMTGSKIAAEYLAMTENEITALAMTRIEIAAFRLDDYMYNIYIVFLMG